MTSLSGFLPDEETLRGYFALHVDGELNFAEAAS